MKRFVKIGIVFVILFMLFEGALAIASGSKLLFIQLTTHAESDGAPSWSSINPKIAFSSLRSGFWGIWTMNTDGSEQTQLTNNPANDGGANWSPDGRKIVFRSDRTGNDDIWKLIFMDTILSQIYLLLL